MPQPADTDWQIVVVGAGAAGLMAAIRAAECGRRTLLVEKNSQAGVKILMSGGTRCNITQATDTAGILRAFGASGPFLHSALHALDPAALLEFFHAERVPTKVESTGKVFPVSDRASDVRDALLRRLARSGAILALNEPLLDLTREARGFRLRTTTRELTAARVIVTTGGKSYPGSGTTGDGYAWATALGHQVITPRPALVPITVREAWVGALRGVTIPDVELRLLPVAAADVPAAAGRTPKKPRMLDQRRGSLLFAHFGLTGPVALDISRTISALDNPASVQLHCDFLPDVKPPQLDEMLQSQARQQGKRLISCLLPEAIPRRLAETLVQLAGLSLEQRGAELSREQRQKLVDRLKQLPIQVTGTMGFKKAEVTAGGIKLHEVDSSSMRSKLVPGLYLAGEVLDLDGWIGGYNFQAAFSTGWLAGESAAMD